MQDHDGVDARDVLQPIRSTDRDDFINKRGSRGHMTPPNVSSFSASNPNSYIAYHQISLYFPSPTSPHLQKLKTMNGDLTAPAAIPPPTRCPADSSCRRSFGGTTAQKNLNSHLKNAHTEYYRTYVRPIKGPKRINHDAYIRQKQKDPEKVKRHRLLARLRKQARKEQVECMKRQRSPSPPQAPDSGLLAIDAANPYFVLESECGVFVGHTKRDLMNCDVVNVRPFIRCNRYNQDLLRFWNRY